MGVDLERELRERSCRRPEDGLGAVEHVERRLVARAQQLMRARLVQPDRAAGVRADLRVRDQPIRAPVRAFGWRIEQVGYGPVFILTSAIGLIAVVFVVMEWVRQAWRDRRVTNGPVSATDAARAAEGDTA